MGPITHLASSCARAWRSDVRAIAPRRSSDGLLALGILALRADPRSKPSTSCAPAALDRALGHLQGLGDIGVGEPAEPSQLDDLRAARIELREGRESFLKGHGGFRSVVERRLDVEERDALCAAPALVCQPRTGVLEKHPTHGHRSVGHELTPGRKALAGATAPYEPHECLVDERRRLKRVVSALPSEMPRGKPTKLGVQRRHELRNGIAVAATGSVEHACHFRGHG